MNAPKKVEAESLAQAMAAAFAEIEGATKSANNPHFKTKYADLTSVIEAIKPALVANNLFFTQNPRPHERGVEIETILHHAGGETFSLGSLFVPADKNNAQGFGSALTYARRYALVTAFGVPVEDDDGNAASAAPQRQREPAAPAFISDEQWAEITALMQATNTEAAKFCGAYSIESVKALPAAAFGQAKAQLQRKLAQMAEREKADA
jgi:hypothetical protein